MDAISTIKTALTPPDARWFEQDNTQAAVCISLLVIPCALAVVAYSLGHIPDVALIATSIVAIAMSLGALVLTSNILTKQQLRAEETIDKRLMLMDKTFLVACRSSAEFTQSQQTLITQTLNKHHPGWSLA